MFSRCLLGWLVLAILVQREYQVARSATHIERAHARFNSRQFDHVPLPDAVKTKTLKIINEVVTGRNFPEQIPDTLGASFPGTIVRVLHWRVATRVAIYRGSVTSRVEFCFSPSEICCTTPDGHFTSIRSGRASARPKYKGIELCDK